MMDVIKLLPDSVANQIAAGEVIQRPASAVKELLENALDADATLIKLIIKDAGKTLIQVVDNGKGMTTTDARFCFERHATSKISQASDLFSIKTMGFRGEALASIAAIARVELKTRTADDALGTEVIIEGSVTEGQQACQCPAGTSISVKNLFFNTPARRNFLKSEQVERSHIYNELIKIALSRPEVEFMYYQNNQLLAKYDKSNLKQRIVSIFGNSYQQKLVPVEETTDVLSITGFTTKPEFARKKRGEQYFFVNQRYIRSPYLGHAVEQAYQELIPEDMFPSFFLFIQTDPSQIDVNVHPTKTEVKFQNERYTYQIIKSAVKRALGRFNLTPTLDFEREPAFDNLPLDKTKAVVPPSITINPDYNPFNEEKAGGGYRSNLSSRVNPEQWEKMFPEKKPSSDFASQTEIKQTDDTKRFDEVQGSGPGKRVIHLHNRYILAPVKSGLMMIDQQRAHERILFERMMKFLVREEAPSQQLLFPESVILMENDAEILRQILPEIRATGFNLDEAAKGTFIVTAVPADITDQGEMQDVMEGIIEQFVRNKTDIKLDIKTNLARSIARRMAVKHGNPMDEQQMIALTESLFSCEMPYKSPSGRPVVVLLGADEIADKFK